MSLEVRPRATSDLPALAAALIKVHDHDKYPVEGVADPLAWLTPDRLLAAWTALVDGRPIGQATLARAGAEDDAARIWQQHTGRDIDQLAIPARLFVDPDHRHQRAGLFLLHEVQAFARDHHLAIAFDVMLKDHAAIRLYETLGCVRIGTITHTHSHGQAEPAAVYATPDSAPHRETPRA
ncbi:GNAT family N-acetyltransferase [Segeticoccus rhizosphaerae]|uniref:GNAT family N-acetyltransferase n=1 Tax=Segeticoccus rhizosphaerae TaxID=1104777 RepID=UPI0012655946|nr:GNAT family N-acetyltransferase [Segeticoccus rhizosphaerae]